VIYRTRRRSFETLAPLMKKRTGNTGKANRRTKKKNEKKKGAKLQGERARLLFEASGELFFGTAAIC
jgi:hypothetical protein